ncbi:BREX-1 system phosphatase PglZ type A [Sporosarcina sp. P26b]|uniref:BREX-1 system phosphatase PglZ type A n=1 Tax=Sporosarcina sp. P26b TaxID=2048253 RepID=UPI003518EB1A
MTQIESAIQDIFDQPLGNGEQRRIVFWMDKEQVFSEEVGRLSLQNVIVHTLTDRNQFQTKYMLEEADPSSCYLIYTDQELSVEDNWLADTVLYSKTFYADRVSLVLNNLQIDPVLRGTVKKYEKFFENKDRYRKFQAFDMENYTEQTIELAMMSALCNIKLPDFEAVLRTVLMDTLVDENNKYMEAMTKFFDVEVFWQHVEGQYGYERETKTLKTLFLHLAVTAFSHAADTAHLISVESFVAKNNRANCLVFIDHWMHHRSDSPVFDDYAEMAEQEIGLSSILQSIPIDQFKQAEVFPYIDRAILIYITNGLMENFEDYEEYTKLIKLRRSKHFYHQYASLYEALYYAVKMHEFRKETSRGIQQGSAIEVYRAYEEEYYKMDTYYRKFYVAFDEESNHELLKKLRESVEHLYTGWFIGELGARWTQAVSSEMTSDWSLPGVQAQQNFYSSVVSPHIRNGERAFVIISDAMRYEVGVELAKRLNTETMGTCSIDSMLSVVPSVTKLGMAALLPHRGLDMDEQGNVLVNGVSSAGIDNRKKIIEGTVSHSIAVKHPDITAMNKAGRRDMLKGKKLVYIYHDAIDAVGDNASTEQSTFQAADQAVNQLYELVKMLRDDVSGTNIYITSDHGFLYQRDALPESDKIEKASVETIEVKRRYMLSKESAEIPGQLAIDLSSVMKNEQQLTAYLPNGIIRNRIQGAGANFVHGGASLQEVVVPLLSFKNIRAGQKGARSIVKVDIKLTSTMRRITNSIFTLDFFQTEKVGDKTNARTVIVYMADEAGSVLSNEETIIGDRTFENPADRTFKLRFVLKSISYDRDKTYYLIMKDRETGVETERIAFSINLGIVSDFDF